MPDLSPTETLAAAVQKLRDAATAIDAPESVRSAPWHVEKCANEESDDCPCIVAQGRFDSGEGPVEARVYVADAETPEYATWIVLMQPGVGLAVADGLEHTAEFLRGVERTHGEVTDLALHNSRHALVVARQLLGAES